MAPSPKSFGSPTAPASVAATEGLTESVLRDTIVLPFNDVDATRELIVSHSADLAAVVIDPVVSRMGFVEATPEYLQMIREVTLELGIVLIFDEVFSFRTGYRGVQGRYGITPDLTALGKVIGGGLPVGATGGSAEIMSVFDQTIKPLRVEHGGTYNANPMTMAAGLASMVQMTPDAYARLDALGERARSGLRDAIADAGLPGKVYGCASMVSLIFSNEPFSNYRELPLRRREAEMVYMLHRYLLNHGVQIIPHGMLILSTAMTEADIDFMVDRARDGMREIATTFNSGSSS